MDSYNRKTDEELLRRMHNGDKKVIDYLMVKYKNLVRKKAKALFLIGADNDDLIQEGMIGLFKAIRDYQEEKDSSFYHFAEICISRQMYTAMEASQRKKHAPLNSYVSLDDGGTAVFDERKPGRYGHRSGECRSISEKN